MKHYSSVFILLLILMVTFSSCDVIEGIFKAGFWSAIILIVLIAGLIFWLVAKIRERR